ncbi:kap p-loop domain-containing protein [Candidatus Magnetobacterium bavaricum]|uniref:Kap p-loop domain-containing protein n=1 Tax=Candidatus Magnetobacterium bavaricum TaxID=29290 RepID=A0A0F3GU43_9BACT|nr:kap p-loop domain-containing protein [Candidatus Magnetobacterium bavaricum]
MILDRPLSIETLLDNEAQRKVITPTLSLIANIASSHTGGIRMRVMGDCGSGKTTYLRMLESFYRDYCAYPVVFVNRWQGETPLSEMLLRLGELHGLNPLTKTKLRQVLRPMLTQSVLSSETLLGALISPNNHTFDDALKLVEDHVERLTAEGRKTEGLVRAIISEIRTDYEAGKTLNVYKKWLQYLLELPVAEKQKKLLVLILDNIDSTRYVKVIEALNTHFDADGVLVIAAVNDAELGADIRQLERGFQLSVELSHTVLNDLHLAGIKAHVTSKQLAHIKAVLSTIDPLPHRKWLKLLDRLERDVILSVSKDPAAFERVFFVSVLKELFPRLEVFSRRFPGLLDDIYGATQEALGSTALVKVIGIIESDTTHLQFPLENFKRLKA